MLLTFITAMSMTNSAVLQQPPTIRPNQVSKVSGSAVSFEPEQLMHGKDMSTPPDDIHNYLVSEKLDGVRGFWDGNHMWSRQGIRILLPQRIKDKLPATPLDGELWAGRGGFSKVSGLINRDNPHHPDWENIQYGVFDTTMPNTPFGFRHVQLYGMLPYYSPEEPVFLLQQLHYSNHRDLQNHFDNIIEQGGEGLMLHQFENLYLGERTNNLLKFKQENELTATVLGYKPGEGKYLGKVGSLKVKSENGREFYVGSGLTDALREAPPNIDSRVCVQHTGFTEHGLPRFPRFVAKTESECGKFE